MKTIVKLTQTQDEKIEKCHIMFLFESMKNFQKRTLALVTQ